MQWVLYMLYHLERKKTKILSLSNCLLGIQVLISEFVIRQQSCNKIGKSTLIDFNLCSTILITSSYVDIFYSYSLPSFFLLYFLSLIF